MSKQERYSKGPAAERTVKVRAPLRFALSIEGTITLSPIGKIEFDVVSLAGETRPKQWGGTENGLLGPTIKLGYSIKEVTQIIPISRSAIYQEIRAGSLPARKMGRRTVILKSDLERWLKL